MSLESFSKKRVLIVDELEAFRFSTKQSLMSLGLKLVDSVSTAQAVISAFQNVDYDLVLCNYDLGKGKNGQQLLEELRHRKLLRFSSLFFIISAEVERGKVMGTLENEPDGYLVKPVTPRDLDQRLGKALETKDALKRINEAIDDGDYRSALAYCDEHLATSKKYTMSCSKIKAWLLLKLGKIKDADKFYESILDNTDTLWVRYGLAKTKMRLKKYSSAQSLLETIIEQDPDYIEAWDLLAELQRLRGDLAESQQTLQKALARSPNSVQRQKALADIAVTNQDRDTALEAFKSVLKLGEQSVYAKPDHYFDFAEYVSSDAEGDSVDEVREAFEILEKANKRFSNKPEIELQTELIGACIQVALGESDKANEALETILQHKEETDDGLGPDTLQVMAKTMRALGREEEALSLLEEAADAAEENSEEIDSIYQQLNSGISSEARLQAASHNKRGIQLYREGKIDEAAKELRMALPLTPRHISLNLNLIQVLIRLAKGEQKKQYIADIEQCLHKVRHIPTHHYEYPRYRYLLERFEQLNA